MRHSGMSGRGAGLSIKWSHLFEIFSLVFQSARPSHFDVALIFENLEHSISHGVYIFREKGVAEFDCFILDDVRN